ncbi:hypothetical protein GGR55DRAFT_253971 [Xylaria sp. FL0064]|nr:hypothetical protein GGR55DRAFT_253971 [Xylaria sp. FL0064]
MSSLLSPKMNTVTGKRKRTETGEPSDERECKRRERQKAQKEKETPRVVTREWLTEHGWRIEEADLSANKAFLSGLVIVKGRLHATDKLCVKGRVVVTEKLECEGNLTLCGSLHCRATPAIVKTMIVVCKGIIHGDVVVNAGVYISGACRVLGTLTVTGDLNIRGYLRCKSLFLTGEVKRLGTNTRLKVDDERVENGVDLAFNELAGSLRQYHLANC